MNDATTRKLERQIERCEKVIARTDRELAPKGEFDEMPGWAVTGASGRTKAMDKAVDRQNERRARAFREQQRAKSLLAWATARLKAYCAGEVHANGQPRADAPSRQKREQAKQEYSLFLRSLLTVGGRAAIAFNPVNTITVKRLNAKSVTDEAGVKWTYDELLPLAEDGAVMDARELKVAYQAWKTAVKP